MEEAEIIGPARTVPSPLRHFVLLAGYAATVFNVFGIVIGSKGGSGVLLNSVAASAVFCAMVGLTCSWALRKLRTTYEAADLAFVFRGWWAAAIIGAPVIGFWAFSFIDRSLNGP